MRTASEGNDKFTSGVDAIRTILVDGFANISNEVGSSKIGNPNSLALSGQTNEAVLQVESWYSWNSITDYSDNIISIKNGYAAAARSETRPTRTASRPMSKARTPIWTPG